METVKLIVCWSMAGLAILAFLCPTVADLLRCFWDIGKKRSKKTKEVHKI